MASAKVLVVGAGPYGVAIAQELWRRGIEFAVVGEPFAMWLGHTLDSMLLRSDCRASQIYTRDGRYSFVRFLEREGTKTVHGTPVATFRRYLREVVEELPFDVVEQRVIHLEQRGEGFYAICDDGATFEARAVIVATGLGPHRYLPRGLRSLPEGRVLHSWDTRRIERLRRQRVLVIGAGQSAAETVARLRGDNRVTWALRHRPLFFREPLRVPTPVFKVMMHASRGLFQLPTPVLRGVSSAVFRTTITPNLKDVYADPGVHKVFEDVRGLSLRKTSAGVASGAAGETFDTIVSATGFRFTLAGLPFLSHSLADQLGRRHTTPALRSDFQTPVPGLYLTGGIAEPTFGPAMRFIFGSRHAARRLGAAMAAI